MYCHLGMVVLAASRAARLAVYQVARMVAIRHQAVRSLPVEVGLGAGRVQSLEGRV